MLHNSCKTNYNWKRQAGCWGPIYNLQPCSLLRNLPNSVWLPTATHQTFLQNQLSPFFQVSPSFRQDLIHRKWIVVVWFQCSQLNQQAEFAKFRSNEHSKTFKYNPWNKLASFSCSLSLMWSTWSDLCQT